MVVVQFLAVLLFFPGTSGVKVEYMQQRIGIGIGITRHGLR